MPRLHGRARRRLRHSHVRSLCPCCATIVLCMVRQCRIPCWFRSCCSSAVVFLPFVPQRQIPMVQTVQQTTEIPQLPFVIRWWMPLLCRSCGSQVVYLRTQRTAWFDSGYMRCVILRSISFSTCIGVVMDPQVDSRPALFQCLLGSTVNTSFCVSLRGWSSWSRRTSRCFPSLSSGP